MVGKENGTTTLEDIWQIFIKENKHFKHMMQSSFPWYLLK